MTLLFTDCDENLIFPLGEDQEVHMTATNTRVVAEAIAMWPDEKGEYPILTPHTLWRLCNEWDGKGDEGKNWSSAPTTGPVIVDCGRRAGYIADKVARIKLLCEEAIKMGALKCYFA